MLKSDIESTNRLLKVMIALMLRGQEENTPTLRQQVKTLSELGMKPIEIAEILGKSSGYVNKEKYHGFYGRRITMKKQKNEQTTDDLIRDQMIIQLGLAGLTQHQIREIVGVDIHRVNRIVKHFKNLKK